MYTSAITGRHEEGNEQITGRNPRSDAPPNSSGAVTYADGDKEMVITDIQATDVAIGLGRIPAGFYAAVWHSGFEWRTANKPVSVDSNVVTWRGLIPIPSDLSASIRIAIYAPFEFQPMLSRGEVLRELTITVQQLLSRNVERLPFTFSPMDGDDRSPCSSLSVSVQRRRRESGNPSVLRVLDPYCSITELPGTLEEATNLGHSALSHYRKRGQILDLERSVEEFERALRDCPPGHPCCAAAQANLAMAKFTWCQIDDSALSFDISIALYRNALANRPTGHPDRPSTLIQLATVHLTRFEKQQNAIDAAQAREFLREAINLSSSQSHANQMAVSLLQLRAGPTTGAVSASSTSSTEQYSASGSTDQDRQSVDIQLLRRYEQFGDLADLQQAISTLEASIPNIVWDRRYSEPLGNLGVALWYRFSHLGELSDLEQAISKQREAVDLTLDDHYDKPGRLGNLGNSLFARYQLLGDLVDLKQAISRHKNAADLTSNGHPDKPHHLNNLGNVFLTRFGRVGKTTFLEEAIFLYQEAVKLTPDGNRNKPACLNNLATSLRARFKQLGMKSDLEEAISVHQKALDSTADGNPNKPAYLRNLATSILTRYTHLSQPNDLDQAILVHQRAVKLTADRHSDKPQHLSNLANTLVARFKRLGVANDLERAVLIHEQAIELTPDDHPDKPRRINSLAISFRTRFECFGELNDIEEALLGHRKAVELAGPSNYVYLNSLVASLITRFKHLGNSGDLGEAISRCKEAVKSAPDGDRNKPILLNDLATSYFTRFECRGRPNDLEQAISRFSKAAALVADDHPDKPDYLNNLAMCLRTRFTHFGQPSDLEQAIVKHREAMHLAPGGYKNKLNSQKNLAIPQSYSGHSSSQASDLEQAVSRYRDVMQLTPDHHPDKCSRLNNLASCLLARFEYLGELKDLEEATSIHDGAAELKNASLADLSSNHGDRRLPDSSRRSLQPYNVIIFGESGAGKSSLVNLIVGKPVAKTSPDAAACTFASSLYHVSLEHNTGMQSYCIWDTTGLNEPEISREDYLRAIKHAYKLISELERSGGVDLLLLCMRGRITKAVQQNYRLFVDVLCKKKIPLGIVVTHLENEVSMEEWWTENEEVFKKYGISADGHACITTISGVHGVFEEKKQESSARMRQLLSELTVNSNKGWKEATQSWFAYSLGKMMKMLRARTGRPTNQELVRQLVANCGFPKKDAIAIADSIEAVRAQNDTDSDVSDRDGGY